jgi:hydroxymethylglutaryl-CoA lyase
MPRLARNTAVSIVNFVHINEVGPRDGIQNTHAVLSVSERFELIRSLEKSGIQSIEIGSFVSPKAVPSMAGTDELFKRLSNKTNYSVLVPNFKGFTLAQENKVEEICLVLCVTDSMNKKNINKTVEETTKEFAEIIKKSKKNDIRTKCYISVAFYCPYEGKVDNGYVADLTNKVISYGVDEIVIADTIGQANPLEVRELFKKLTKSNDTDLFSAHFHDTKALGLSNVFASLEEGISKFDSCIGGLGGCPFAPGSTGNLATEDLVGMMEMMNIDTGIDIDNLLQSRELASKLTSLDLVGRMY